MSLPRDDDQDELGKQLLAASKKNLLDTVKVLVAQGSPVEYQDTDEASCGELRIYLHCVDSVLTPTACWLLMVFRTGDGLHCYGPVITVTFQSLNICCSRKQTWITETQR